MTNGIVVFIEHKNGVENKSSIEAIAAAQSLGATLGQPVIVVIPGSDVATLAQTIAAYDVSKVVCAVNSKLSDYTPDAYADAMEKIVRQLDPAFVFLTHTYLVRDFA